jgi:hypothetical protein
MHANMKRTVTLALLLCALCGCTRTLGGAVITPWGWWLPNDASAHAVPDASRGRK